MNLPAISFGIGVLAQSLYLLRGSKDKNTARLLLILTALAALLSFFTYFTVSKNPTTVILVSVVIFFISFAFAFQKYLLAEINPTTLGVWTACAGYLVMHRFQAWPVVSMPFFVFIFLIVLVATFVKSAETKIKTLFYIWFMILSTTVTFLLYFTSRSFASLSDFTISEAFFAGVLCCLPLLYLLYLLFFIPIPDKNQTFDQRLAEVKDHAHRLAEKWNFSSRHPAITLVLTVGCFFLLVGNKYIHVMSDTLLIGAILSVSGLTFFVRPLR